MEGAKNHVKHHLLLARLEAITFPAHGVVRFDLAEYGSPDMTGAVQLASVLDPAAHLIEVFAGGKPLCGYFRGEGDTWSWVEKDERGKPMHVGTGGGKHGVIVCQGKRLGHDEPVFLLRATDPDAPAAVRDYGGRCVKRGCDSAHTNAVFAHAAAIDAWQKANPHLVKEKAD